MDIEDLKIQIEEDAVYYGMTFSEAQNKYHLIIVDSIFKETGINISDYYTFELDTSNLTADVNLANESGFDLITDEVVTEAYFVIDSYQQIACVTDNNELVLLPLFKEYDGDVIENVDGLVDILRDKQIKSMTKELYIEVRTDVDDFKCELANCDIEVKGYCDYEGYIEKMMEANQKAVDSVYSKENINKKGETNPHFDAWLESYAKEMKNYSKKCNDIQYEK
jgi:hypothetical protein